MRVEDLHNDSGVLTGFQVSNALLGRRRACELASAVPGALVVRAPRVFRSGGDDFCAFEVDGVPFLIIEPFGDNSRYWVVAAEPNPGAAALIARVRAVFAAA
jgi:hypothetical protein